MNFHNFKKALLATGAIGGGVGLTLGLLFTNRTIVVSCKHIDKHKYHNIVFHKFEGITLTCIACTFLVPLAIVCLPLALADCFGNFCVVDRLVDDFNTKNTVRIKRYHQHDGRDYKYFAPSTLVINIDWKE